MAPASRKNADLWSRPARNGSRLRRSGWKPASGGPDTTLRGLLVPVKHRNVGLRSPRNPIRVCAALRAGGLRERARRVRRPTAQRRIKEHGPYGPWHTVMKGYHGLPAADHGTRRWLPQSWMPPPRSDNNTLPRAGEEREMEMRSAEWGARSEKTKAKHGEIPRCARDEIMKARLRPPR